jgi:hypothetical protein
MMKSSEEDLTPTPLLKGEGRGFKRLYFCL